MCHYADYERDSDVRSMWFSSPRSLSDQHQAENEPAEEVLMTPAEVLPGGPTRGKHEVQNLEQAGQNSDRV